MSRASILLLSASHLCRNPRVFKEAVTLGAAGYEVTVMTVLSSPRFQALDQALLAGQPFRHVTLDLTGTAAGTRGQSFWQRATTKLARLLLRYFRLESAQALGPAHALLQRARHTPADLIIAHTEIPLWAAQHLIKDGRRVAVDFEDWYSEDLLESDRAHRPLRLLRRAEAHALRHASYCSTTSASLSAALQARHGGQPALVLHNTFPLQPVSQLDRPAGNDPVGLVWFSQTIGPGRGLEWFVPAWAHSTVPSRLTLIGDLRADFGRQLETLVPAHRRADLQLLPSLPADQLPLHLTGYAIGLALEPSHPANKNLTISNKIFQYLNAGLAVIATDTAGQREVMQAVPDSGLLVPPAEQSRLSAQLDRLLADRPRLRRMQEAARAAAEKDFCWEKDAKKLLTAVAAALAQPAGGKP